MYTSTPTHTLKTPYREIPVFSGLSDSANLDEETVKSFGEEWEKFHQFDEQQIQQSGDQYFDIVTEEMLPPSSKVLDIGCGSGRWSWYIQSKVKEVHAVDPSKAILAADHLLADVPKVTLAQASIDALPFEDNSFDFAFCLGVLHHMPDTSDGMKKCVAKVKKGGWFLVYIYYKLENRGPLYKGLFQLVNLVRNVISKLPTKAKHAVCDVIAASVYWPLANLSRLLTKLNVSDTVTQKIPLSYYADKSFFIMRTDALDRFGTPLEKRFSKSEIEYMMRKAGLNNIHFSENVPYWHACGQKM